MLNEESAWKKFIDKKPSQLGSPGIEENEEYDDDNRGAPVSLKFIKNFVTTNNVTGGIRTSESKALKVFQAKSMYTCMQNLSNHSSEWSVESNCGSTKSEADEISKQLNEEIPDKEHLQYFKTHDTLFPKRGSAAFARLKKMFRLRESPLVSFIRGNSNNSNTKNQITPIVEESKQEDVSSPRRLVKSITSLGNFITSPFRFSPSPIKKEQDNSS